MKPQKLNNGAKTILAQQSEEVKRKASRKAWYYVSENNIGFDCDVCVFATAKQALTSIVELVEDYAKDGELYARATAGYTAADLETIGAPYRYTPGKLTAWEKWTIQKTRTDTKPLDLYGKVETYFIYREHYADGGATVTLYDSADGETPNTAAPVVVRKTAPAKLDPADQADGNKAFTALLRAYETAHATGADTAAPLYALATAAALSVLKKVIDPQRKSAAERETVSNSGLSPALTAVRRGIKADIALLEKLTAAHNAAYSLEYNAAGDLVQVVIDKGAEKAAAALQSETLSDGLDLVNAAVVAILEQTADHATAAPGWLETPYTIRRLSRKVLIRADDTAKWEEVETSPIQEVYRAIRREVQNSRAMQTDPRNGYTYIEDTAADPDSTATETIYRRLHKWADLGGFTNSGHYEPHGHAARSTIYTADAQTAADYDAIVAALNLSERQATVIRLRMSGYGYAAIATYLGIRQPHIVRTCQQVQAKAEKIGFTPDMWAEMTAEN